MLCNLDNKEYILIMSLQSGGEASVELCTRYLRNGQRETFLMMLAGFITEFTDVTPLVGTVEQTEACPKLEPLLLRSCWHPLLESKKSKGIWLLVLVYHGSNQIFSPNAFFPLFVFLKLIFTIEFSYTFETIQELCRCSGFSRLLGF